MKKSGFTLIELMIVIVILGVLSLIGVNAFTSSQVRSRDAKRKADLANFQKSLEFYYNDYNSFPLSSDPDGEVVCKSDGTVCKWGEIFQDENDTIYMIKLPKEANGSNRYFYVSDGVDYRVYARLENPEDAGIPDPLPDTYLATDCAVGAEDLDCNYGIASVNTTP